MLGWLGMVRAGQVRRGRAGKGWVWVGGVCAGFVFLDDPANQKVSLGFANVYVLANVQVERWDVSVGQ